MNLKDEFSLPAKPRLEDFGLTEDTVKPIPGFLQQDHWVFLSVWIATPAYLFWSSEWSWISIIMFSLPIGGLIAIVCYSLHFAIARWWKLRFIRGYAESKRYADAAAAYKNKVTAYFNRQLTALGVGHQRKKTIEEHHEDNLSAIRQFGRVLADVTEQNAIAANLSLLRLSKERIKGALLDEIFAELLCEKRQNLDALQAGLMHTAMFQQLDRPLVLDPIGEVTDAEQAARSKGLDVSTETLIRAIANAGSGARYKNVQSLQKRMIDEQAELVDLLTDLGALAKTVRNLDRYRVSQYQRYFST